MHIFWLLVACGGAVPDGAVLKPEVEEEQVEEVRATPLAPAVQPEISIPQMPDGEAPPIVLVWDGIAALHKGFFSDATLVGSLSAELGSQVRPPANVHIQFDSAKHLGRINLRLLPETLIPTVHHEGNAVGISALSPILVALARYRSGVAGRYDVRVESFHIGVESFRGINHCVFTAGGISPPDGRTVNVCVTVNGQKVCGTEEGDQVKFPEASATAVRACLN